MNTQQFDWGQIEWIYEPESPDSPNVMNIGIFTILPGKSQKKHVHYGDEQFLYILSGRATQTIGCDVSIMKPKTFFHIEAGAIHETINDGEEPFRELVISVPANFDSYFSADKKITLSTKNRTGPVAPLVLGEKIQKVVDTYANTLQIPVSIFDRSGSLLIEGKNYPEICNFQCHGQCGMYEIQDVYKPPFYKEPTAFVCPYELSVIIFPIIYNDEILGVIKGGHIRMTPDEIVHQARVKAIILLIKKLSKVIIDEYEFENTKLELDKKEETIHDISQHDTMLSQMIKSTQEKALSIQINNHFLFNTLNAIASLSVKENAGKTYDSIISLSQMFRYMIRTAKSLVTLKDEIDYLKTYIHLQKLRFGERLIVNFDISSELEDIYIPFNCFQPILENCFVHGFKNHKGLMLISFVAHRDDEGICVEISDNGCGMDEGELKVLRKRIAGQEVEETVSGLTMVASRLRHLYHERYKLGVMSEKGKGSIVRIQLPLDTNTALN